MAPLHLTGGTIGYALTFGALGFGFGAALEMGGFGDTRKLAAQFYFRDMTVLKVMFTAMVVAAVLVAGAASFGLLDLSRVWVNPTYLWPGVVGGLVMGVGFILGGFCPGTSLVAASTLKVDGMVFLLGALVGVWGFGETVSWFEPFYLSSYMGRFTLDQLLHVPMGVAVLLVVAMALLMFWGGELLERHYGKGQPWAAIPLLPSRGKLAFAGALVAAAAVLVVRGDPTPEQRWAWTAPDVKRAVEDRGMFVDPAEVVALRKDVNVQTDVLDLRDEHDFNLFHVGGARRVEPAALGRLSDETKRLVDRPAGTVTFLIGNGEAAALAAWKSLRALGASNVYVVEGGVNGWLARYGVPECVATRTAPPAAGADALAWRFAHATGEREPASWPERPHSQLFRSPCEEAVSRGGEGGHDEVVWPAYAFTKKVKLQTKAAVKGGCG